MDSQHKCRQVKIWGVLWEALERWSLILKDVANWGSWVVAYINVCNKHVRSRVEIFERFQTPPGRDCLWVIVLPIVFLVSSHLSSLLKRWMETLASPWQSQILVTIPLETLDIAMATVTCLRLPSLSLAIPRFSWQLLWNLPMPDAVMAIITHSIAIAIAVVMALSVDLSSSSLSFPSVYWRDCEDKDEALPKLFSTYQIEHQPFDNWHWQPHQSPSDGPPSHLSSLQITISVSSELNINHSNLSLNTDNVTSRYPLSVDSSQSGSYRISSKPVGAGRFDCVVLPYHRCLIGVDPTTKNPDPFKCCWSISSR